MLVSRAVVVISKQVSKTSKVCPLDDWTLDLDAQVEEGTDATYYVKTEP